MAFDNGSCYPRAYAVVGTWVLTWRRGGWFTFLFEFSQIRVRLPPGDSHLPFHTEASPMRRLLLSALLLAVPPLVHAADDYKLGPDSQEQPNVPKGKVTKHSWTSQIFPGTVRDYWVYVPAQYDANKPACVMVFQDGGSYVNEKGQFRTTIVFDNLIHKKEMPATVGIFINSGVVPPAKPDQ